MPDRTGALEGVDTLQAYTEWMKGLLTPITDGRAAVRPFAVDEARSKVSASGVFMEHTPAKGTQSQWAAEHFACTAGRRPTTMT